MDTVAGATVNSFPYPDVDDCPKGNDVPCFFQSISNEHKEKLKESIHRHGFDYT